MKKLILIKHYIVLIIFLSIIYSCKKNDTFIEPVAKMNITSNNLTVLQTLEIKNYGNGEYFSFWPGDEGHNYNLKSSGGNTGLPPNSGNDFKYVYLKAGIYTIYMVASSYDGDNNKFVQKIDSASITVTGAALNYFTGFGIYHAWTSYTPLGKISNDSISINIAPFNRILGYPDSLMAYIVNGKAPWFSAAENMSYISVNDADQNNISLKGDGTDAVKLNMFKIIDANTVEPIIKTFTIVENSSQNVHTYKVAAMMYPELYSFSIEGDTALMFSTDGLTQPTSDQMNNYLITKPDSIFIGIFLGNGQVITSVKPIFTATQGSVVTLNGIVQTSGNSSVDFTKQPIVYEITQNFNGFKISTKVAVNYLVF
jgi:hypothetical protein